MAITVALFAPTEAEACSYACSGPRLAPEVPSNSPAIVLVKSPGGPDLGAFAVRSEDGGRVPASFAQSFDGVVIVPAAPLEADAGYVVEFKDRCYFTDDGGTGRLAFRTTSPAPLPTTGGTASVTSRFGSVAVPVSSGECSHPYQAAIADIQVVPSADLRPFLATTAFTFSVDDGGTRRSAAYGALQLSFSGKCVGQTGLEANGLSLGHHTVLVGAEVAGSNQSLPVNSVDFTLSCEGLCLNGKNGGADSGTWEGNLDCQGRRPSGCAAAPGVPALGLLVLRAARRRRIFS